MQVCESAIYCVNGKCIYPARKCIKDNLQDGHADVYGNNDHYFNRFKYLGSPLFTMVNNTPIDIDETIHYETDIVIPDGMFDGFVEKVEKHKKKSETRKYRKKKEKK